MNPSSQIWFASLTFSCYRLSIIPAQNPLSMESALTCISDSRLYYFVSRLRQLIGSLELRFPCSPISTGLETTSRPTCGLVLISQGDRRRTASSLLLLPFFSMNLTLHKQSAFPYFPTFIPPSPTPFLSPNSKASSSSITLQCWAEGARSSTARPFIFLADQPLEIRDNSGTQLFTT